MNFVNFNTLLPYEALNGGDTGLKRSDFRNRGYLDYGSYIEFALGQIRNGGAWSSVKTVYKRIRKYTLITAVFRTAAAVIVLLEKSALLLLTLTVLLFLLPIALIPLLLFGAGSVIGYFKMHRQVSEWLKEAESVTVYISSSNFFGEGEHRKRRPAVFEVLRPPQKRDREGEGRNGFDSRPLFARCATVESEEYTHPVIVVCGDRFLTAKWGGFNLLAVKCDYFYILKKYYFKDKNVSFLIID